MHIRSIARALTILLIGATAVATMSMPAVAGNPTGVPSGAGWGAGYYFNAPRDLDFWVDLPDDMIGGTITWDAQNAATLSLNVTQNKAGPCVHGSVNDFDSGVSINILNTVACQVGTAGTSAVEASPMGEYDISICAGTNGTMCNGLTIYNLQAWNTEPAGSYALWFYTSATQMKFNMAVGSATLSGTATHSVNGFTATSTVSENMNSPFACVSATAGDSGTSRCGPGTMPLNFSSPFAFDFVFAYSMFGNSIFGSTEREILFTSNPESG